MESNQPMGSMCGITRVSSLEEEREKWVPIIKEFRQQIDALIQRVPLFYNLDNKNEIIINNFSSKEPLTQVRLKLVEAKMWAGKILESLGNPFPPELADKAK